MESAGLTIVVPVYNERGSVESTIDRIKRLRTDIDGAVSIVIVDDASTDGTRELLDGLAGDDITVIHCAVNRGYGASLKIGMKAATHDLVAITDADGTYPLERIADMYREMRSANVDMMVGARVGAGAKIPLVRRPAKWCLSVLANFLVGQKIPDLNSGLRIMRKDVVQRFLNILPDGFSFTTTITLAMLTNGYEVRFTPICYEARVGRSKMRPIYDTLNFIQLICRTTLYFNPLRVFIPAEPRPRRRRAARCSWEAGSSSAGRWM